MNLHEYQSKELMAACGLPVLPGRLLHQADQAARAFSELGSGICVVKAQVHAGGRGKAGGVKLVKSAAEAVDAAASILGMRLITPQTGPQGKLVRKVYIEKGCNIGHEYYLSLLVNRASRCLSIIASAQGGMEIEKLAHESPEKIVTVSILPGMGLTEAQTDELLSRLALPGSSRNGLSQLLQGLYRMFMDNDLSLIEINPLVLTKENSFVILDAKCSVDDNALFRHPQLKTLMDPDEMDPREVKAAEFGLNYIALDGSIGCMVNGAGLAMATMDIIKKHGGTPANFLDVGGGATKETVTEAFRLLLSDGQVKAILVNIFGGIMRCDVIAGGIVEAAREIRVAVPLVVRLEGTNIELGRKILSESGLKIIAASGMDDAARKVVEASK